MRLDDGRPLSDDHCVPRLFIERVQPRARGFAYGGTLPTHRECNNEFSPESSCKKALRLIGTLLNEDSFVTGRLPSGEMIKVISSEAFADFSKADLQRFGLLDARETSMEDIASGAFFKEEQPGNPLSAAVRNALAVVAKSAAALLVRNHLVGVPNVWRILAAPWHSDATNVSFNSVLGERMPYDDGVSCHIKQLKESPGDWFVVFSARHFHVFMLFAFSGNPQISHQVADVITDGGDVFRWEGCRLSGLQGMDWQLVHRD